jgi:hypothetical protein
MASRKTRDKAIEAAGWTLRFLLFALGGGAALLALPAGASLVWLAVQFWL